MIKLAVITWVVALGLWCLATACTGPDLIVGELRTDADTADTSDGAVPCSSDLMCDGEESHCDVTRGRCVECTSTEHCSGDEHPLCNIDSGQCVDCLTDTDCPDNRLCQIREGECEDTR